MATVLTSDAAVAASRRQAWNEPHGFVCMGTDVAVWIDHDDAARRAELYDALEQLMRAFDRRFTRFDPTSELSRVNRCREAVVDVSGEFADWFSAALWAAEWTGGVVDPTLLAAVKRAGYTHSLADAQATCPPVVAFASQSGGAPAAPSPAALWREFRVDRHTLKLTRPPGVELDSGGTGKGYVVDLAAALLAEKLPEGARWFVDAGGDMRLSAVASGAPHTVLAEHPLAGEPTHRLRVWGGAVATSSVARRIWPDREHGYAHHLIDPSTGRPAWTGVISATAVGTSALQAETLAKWALLAGPDGARQLLNGRGGLFVHYDGVVETVAAGGAV